MDINNVMRVKKSEWKKRVKERIQKAVEVVRKSKEMKKMRHVGKGKFGKKKYIWEMKTEEVSECLSFLGLLIFLNIIRLLSASKLQDQLYTFISDIDKNVKYFPVKSFVGYTNRVKIRC